MKKDYIQQFKDDFLYWVTYYGMWEWEYYFKVKRLDCLAEVHCSVPDMIVTVFVHPDLEKMCTEQGDLLDEINVTAHHEVSELMLGKLRNIAAEKIFDDEQWEQEAHSVIHRIQRGQYSEIHNRKNGTKPRKA